ncbi:MAG: FAD-dependent oxidoreductase, partial [Marmoricola sp.]
MKASCDVVVVGAGGAGMTAALAAARNGLDTVLIEKSAYFGGSTARSGGGVWIPGNYAIKAAGEVDPGDAEASRLYLQSIVGEKVPAIRRETYLDRGPELMDFLKENTPVRFKWVPEYADYLPEAPGGRPRGRTVEPIPLNAKFLGEELGRLHPPYGKAPANLIITQADFRKISLGMRTIKGPLTLIRATLMRLLTLLLGKKMYAMGNAIAIGLRKGIQDAGVPVEYETELTDLVIENGRVVGVSVLRNGETLVIRASKGVILGSGGFEKNLEMREKYQPQPTSVDWTTGAESNQGGGILAGIAAGAEIDLMDDAWWGPTIPLPNGPWFCLAERNLPGSIIVNAAGNRYMNEALPYVEATHEIYKGEATGITHVPSWMIIDQRYRNRYLFAGLGPRQPFPGRWLKEGVIKKSSTIEGLAEAIEVP